jgi:hypothetical protein
MWKGVVLGFAMLGFVLTMFLTVFSKVMPSHDDEEGKDLDPQDM